MAIKDSPTKVFDYYRLLKERVVEKHEKVLKKKHYEEDERLELYERLKENAERIKESTNIDITKMKEFEKNTYIDGSFHSIAKSLFANRQNSYELISDLYDLFKYAELSKSIHLLEKQIEVYNRILDLNIKMYKKILKTFYDEVHRRMIVNGEGYAFTGRLGWICINRCVLKKPKTMLDYQGTKRKEKELIEKGIRIYNKEEAEWCQKNGIKYEAEDKRVYRTVEYCYEIPLLCCRLPQGTKLKLKTSNWTHNDLRKKSDDELINIGNKDKNDICKLDIDLRTKLKLCEKIDSMLYTKFIRNENQDSYIYTPANRKN